MNQIPESKLVPEGLLEIISKEDQNIIARINVFKLQDNLWRYVRSNGQTLCKESTSSPKDFASSLKLMYLIQKGKSINTKYTLNQTSPSYSLK